jgi:hypothetical protein
MTGTTANDLTWLKSLIERYVPCSCYTIRLWRSCLGKPWCLRETHMHRLRFFRDSLAFDLAMKGITTVLPLGEVPHKKPRRNTGIRGILGRRES